MSPTQRRDFPQREQIIQSRVHFLATLKRTIGEESKLQHDTIVNALQCVYTEVAQNKNRHYLAWSLDDPLRISYAHRCHRHDAVHRTKTTLGRYLRRFLPNTVDSLSDTHLEVMVARVLAKQVDQLRITIVTGEAILEAYRNAVGGYSCMTGTDSQYAVDLYARNDCCRMIIYRHNGISARALLWKTDDGATVMDRIYPNSGNHIEIMRSYARQRNWIFRQNCGAPSGGTEILSDESRHAVTVESPNGHWPYMDTFRYAKGDSDSAVLRNYRPSEEYTVLDSTSGNYDDNDTPQYVCDDCEEYADEVSETESGYQVCDECRRLHYTYSEIQNILILDDNLVTLEDSDSIVSESYAEDYCSRCEYCREYYRRQCNLIETPDGEGLYCTNCFSDHYSECSECRDTFANTALSADGLCSDCENLLPKETEDEELAHNLAN